MKIFKISTQKPEKDKWGSCEEALESALQLEKVVYQNLLDIHQVASEKADPHVSGEMDVLSWTAEAWPWTLSRGLRRSLHVVFTTQFAGEDLSQNKLCKHCFVVIYKSLP